MTIYHIILVVSLPTPEDKQRGQIFSYNCNAYGYDNLTLAIQGNKYTFEFDWQTPHSIDEVEYEMTLDLCQFFMIEACPSVNPDEGLDPLNWSPNPIFNNIDVFEFITDITVEAI